jgi:hypothetical protein
VGIVGDAHPAGNSPPIAVAVNGRASLPIICTAASSVAFELGDDATLDAATHALPDFQERLKADRLGRAATVQVVAGRPVRIDMNVSAPTDANGGITESPAQVVAGTELQLRLRALDVHGNVSLSCTCESTLEADVEPRVDDELASSGSTRAQATMQPYLIKLDQGEANKVVHTSTAGKLTLRLTKLTEPIDGSATFATQVVADKAVAIDVVKIPEAGRAGLDFELVVRAHDRFGNTDESFEKEVSLDHDNNVPVGSELLLQNHGLLKLTRGKARTRVTRKPEIDKEAAPVST